MANKKVRMIKDTRYTFGVARKGREYPVPEGIANRWASRGIAEIIGDADEGVVVEGTAQNLETAQIERGNATAVDPDNAQANARQPQIGDKAIYSSMNSGDFNGTISGVEDGKVTIQLEDGRNVTPNSQGEGAGTWRFAPTE